ncbi:NlpC/P60 family protein [Desulfuromonas sp. TF]|uniref:NlpC/P60 family protein n=1 Tax=Desulfuromonas sp. TF TaxID=1232410 RepID=UPI00041B2228|nr:NlpC/P60 family protein [Desulfuromonas sp. TF]
MPSAGIIIIALLSTMLFGCASPTPIRKSITLPDPDEKSESLISGSAIGRIAYSVQIGAFSIPENARRLEKALRAEGLDAYFFCDESGLYKVRFGDFSTFDNASREAAGLQKMGKIENYLIVSPQGDVSDGIRSNLVDTATRFLGVPYSRGGEFADEGFDCSGLTMAVYRLNGLKLPRESNQQFKAGRHVDRQNLKKGDLVFFSTERGRKVSHVGIYIAYGKFIHAPRPGKSVKIADLDSAYFKQRYAGARTYF